MSRHVAPMAPRRLPQPASRLRGDGTAARRAWRGSYVRSLVLADFAAAVAATVVGFTVRFVPSEAVASRDSLWLAALLPFVWVVAVQMSRSYEERFLWVGAEEFRRVVAAGVALLATVGTVSWAFDLTVARGLVVVAVPLAALFTLLSRYAQRKRLHRRRNHGQHLQTTLVVGHRGAVAALARELNRYGYHGYQVVGCCLPAAQGGDGDFQDLPVLGDLQDVVDVVGTHEIDAVAVLPCPELDGPALRRLGWQLERTSAELLLAPAVTEVAGPRIHIRPVCGLPLMHMERPELRGMRRLTKELVDRSAALVLLLLLTPVLLGLTLAVAVSSRGPVLYRQERIGRDGRTFTMLKFRTMADGADRAWSVLSAANDGNGVLFKMRDDPRVTRVGRFLRRFSLDELPQLVNVLRGNMSLVGPRPPLAREVELYGEDMHRRFLVKPGLTGLWQISGRSNLSWDDSIRIDVRYVENWSLAFDFMILWKTVGAVLRGPGAY